MKRHHDALPRLPGLLSLVLLVLLLSACHGGGAALQPYDSRTPGSFTLRVLPDSFLGERPSGAFALDVEQSGQELAVNVRVRGAQGLKALYFELDYDSQRFSPLAARSSGVLRGDTEGQARPGDGSAGLGDPPLVLAVLNQSGAVHYGEVLPHFDQRPGFSGDGVLATVRFQPGPFVPRETSDPPVTDASCSEMHWDAQSRTLTWFYACQGDYNQDGLVTLGDLTPLGRFFGAGGPFDPQSALSAVDGNDDGLITINDLTPIGVNFGRGVEGYNVFASMDPGTLPASNDQEPALAPMDFVPFSEHLGTAQTERLGFFREYPGLDPETILWVRPVSTSKSGTPSAPQHPGLCMWQLRNVSSFASVITGGTHNSLAVVGGLPAIAYRDHLNQRLVYQRAMDTAGAAWGTEVVVDSGSNMGFFASLVVANGCPLVCHYDWTAGDLRCVRAIDPLGAMWGAPQVIDSVGNVGWDCRMQLVNGNPAISYHDIDNHKIKFVRSTNINGTSWAPPVVVADAGTGPSGDGDYASLAVIGGKPAIAFFNRTTHDLKYIRAEDPNGASWGPMVTAASGPDEGRYCALLEVHSAPGIAYLASGGLAYVRGADSTGSAWGAPVLVDSGGSLAADMGGVATELYASLAIINGKPAISYYSGPTDGDLMLVRALDADGTAWAAPLTIDSTDNAGSFSNLVMIGAEPGISYLDETSWQLKYATCVGGGNLAPVAFVDVAGGNLLPGQPVAFDASRSYDPDGAIELFEWDFDGDQVFEVQTGASPTAEHSFGNPGEYLIAVHAVDSGGAGGYASVPVTIGLPGRLPEAALQATPEDVAVNESVNFDASASTDPDGTIVLYEWDLAGDGDFELNTGADPHINYEYSAAGVYNPGVRVTDDANLKCTASVSVNVAVANQRPVAALSVTPAAGNPPYMVSLDASQSSDPDGSITKYEWDFNGDGIFEASSDTDSHFNWQCVLPGDIRLGVRITDNLGAKATMYTTTTSNHPPVAKIVADHYSGTAPFTVNFDGSGSTDQDGTIDTYGWDLFDDGTYDSTGVGTPKPWSCEMLWNGGVKMRLKVKDNQGATASAVVTINVSKGWHVHTLDPVGMAGWFNSLAVVNGFPAVAYYEYNNRNMKYIRATDSLGANSWALPVNIGSIALPGYGCYGLSLAEISGTTPGIVFGGTLNGNGSYVLANNSTGASWGAFITALAGGSILNPCIKVVGGKPAFATRTMGVEYVRATEAAGSTWGNPVTAASTPGGLFGGSCWMEIVSGNPAIAYSERFGSADKLRYVRATNTSGTAWGTPATIDSTGDPGEDVHLAVINGRPAVAYVATASSGYFEVRYKRANDATGTAWSAAAQSIGSEGRAVLGLVEIGGTPAIGLVTCGGHDIEYFHATNAAGSTWPAGEVVDASDKNTGMGSMGGSMIAISDHPAMSYHNSVNADLKYAVWE